MPALLTGSTVVVRPSPLTPIATLVIGEAAEAVGLPAGVLNVVVEGGVEGGQLLSSHPAVDCVSFTGSTAVGKLIMAQAAATVKRVLLELGGKSVQLYLADAVDRAPMGCASVFAAHSGRRAWPRRGCSFPRNAKPRCWKRQRASLPCSSWATRATPQQCLAP